MKTLVQSLRMVSALVAGILIVNPAWAATEHWLGAGSDQNWTTTANWSSPQQTYFNQVDFIDNGGTTNLNDFSVNNIFNSATGAAQCPIYQLRMYPTNRNFTTLISPGVALYTGAGQGQLYVGGDTITTARGIANLQETITFTGPGALLAVTGSLNVGQGMTNLVQTVPASTNYVTLNMSGLDNFAMMPSITGGTKIQGISVGNTANGASGSRFLLCGQIHPYSQGAIYLAKTNIIVLGNDLEIGAMSVYSNSMPCPLYLGMSNSILVGSSGAANGLVTVGSRGNTNAFLTFNPAFLGGATPPVATIASPSSINGGRVTTFYICRSDGGVIPAYGYADFTGGNVTIQASAMQVGYAGANGINALGVLTFDNGVVDVNNLTNGNQTVSSGGIGVGIINLNTNSTYATNALLRVNNILTLAAVTNSGTLTPGTAGTININGGALAANTIINGLGTGTINMSRGSLTITGTAGTPAAPITSLSATNSALQFSLALTSTNAVITSLTTGGTNTINIASAPPLSSVPVVLRLISYSGGIAGAGYNFTLGSLPPLCAGYLSNDTANSSIDLVLTSGPLGLTWVGNLSGDWNTTTANWTAAGPNDYADGDYVTFPDGASTGAVNLTGAFAPGSVVVTNASLPYTFTGSGDIGGSGGLVKQGTGTLIIDNSGINNFNGATTIANGTVQIGNGDTSGNLPGNIVNNGSLVFDRTDSPTIPNAISGTGSLVQGGGNSLLLSGANSFSGGITVSNNSTLQLGSASAVGTATGGLTIASGSTLDANGYSVVKSITVSGTGVGGNGAITDNGASLTDASIGLATNVILAGDTTFSFPTRWDLGQSGTGSVLSSGGHAYNLTLTSGANAYFEWRNLAVDAALGNITVVSGTLGIVGSTTLGSPSSTLTLSPGAGLTFYNATANANINKQVDFQNGATIKNGGGANVMNGAMTLEPGYCTFNVGGTSLTLSNVLSGSGYLYATGGTSPLILSGNSPSFTGGVLLYTGQLTLNGTIGSGITSQSGTTVTGAGTANGLVDVSGTLLPGGTGAAGTFTASGLTLESGSTLTMDLNAANTVGGGVNDLIVVNGDLAANGNTLYINPIGASLTGPYTLLTYTGNANSFFGGAATVAASRYIFTLTNVTTTTPKQVNLLVSGSGGGPASLIWNNAGNNGTWDTQGSQNWSNQTTHAAADYFFTQDSVTFDDSITGAAHPTTSISIPGLVIPSVLTNNSTANYTLGGAGKISGGASIVKLGSSTLTIQTTNDFTGKVTVQAGTILQGTNNALGSATGTLYITNTGTVDLNGFTLGSKPVVVSGVGVNANGAIINSGGPVYDNGNGLTSVTLAGDTTFGGTNRWDLGNSTGGTLSTGGHAYNLSLTGNAVGTANPSYSEWDNLTIDPTLANINILAGELGVKGMTSLGNPASTVTIYTGGQMTFWGGSGYAKNFDVKSGGILLVRRDGPTFNFNLTLEGGSTFGSVDNAKVLTGPVNLTGLVHFLVGNASCTFSNVISGAGGFYMDNYDSNPLIFTATNTYSGPTLLTNSGSGLILALVGNGSISSSTNIGLTAGTTLDVSGRTDKTLTLASGQTMGGSGTVRGSLTASAGSTLSPGLSGTGTLTVTNAVTLQGTTAMSAGTGFNNLLNATNIGYGGTLSLTFTPGTLAAGNSFKLFNAGTYSGSFASIMPSSPGAGLAWDTSQLTVSGRLNVVSSTPPQIGGITVTGTNLSITGTGGTPNGTYHVRTSTNAAAHLSTWTVFGNGSFDGSGHFNFNGAINPSEPQRFYILVEP